MTRVECRVMSVRQSSLGIRHSPVLYPRVLVTGAHGLIGQALVRHLSTWPEGDLLATGREAEPLVTLRAGGYLPLDVTDAEAVERVFEDFAPNVVVHCAAESKVEACEADRALCWAVNVDATALFARLCHHHGARLVFLSTDFLFDGAAGPYAEDDRPAPLNQYGRTKLAAENAIRTSKLRRWAVVRTSMVFGAGDGLRRLNLATLVARELGAGRLFLAAHDQHRTPTYAPDLAEGIGRIIRFGKDGVFHLAGREVLTAFRFAQKTAEAFGLDTTLVQPTTTAELHPDGPRPLRAGLVVLRAEAELSFRPRPLDAALAHLASELGLPVPADS